jgi:AAA family ATP:ADP antiporter
VSVLNLFVVAVFWSLMADVFSREQAGRFFGFIAGGLSLGGLAGPSLAGWLAGPLGTLNLLLISAALLLVAAALMRRITRWQTLRAKVGADVVDVDVALRGSAWGGFAQVASSPYLIGIALFVLMSCAVNTIMYVEQGRAVAAAIATPDLRTALFGKIDFGVQATALLIQLFLFGRLLRRFGFCVMLGSIPLLMILAFATVGLSSSLQVVLGAIVARRVGEYAVTKPCRDMLFTVVSREQKYKAKSLLDTFVYRGADALAASAYAGVVALASTAGTAAGLAGIAVASIWLTVSIWLARRFSAASGERRPGAVPAAVEPPAESRALHLPPELRCTTVSLPHLGDRHDDDHRLQLSLHQGRADSSSCGEHRVVLDSIK